MAAMSRVEGSSLGEMFLNVFDVAIRCLAPGAFSVAMFLVILPEIDGFTARSWASSE